MFICSAEKPFQLIDLYSIATAADVVGGYKFEITGEIRDFVYHDDARCAPLGCRAGNTVLHGKTRNKILLRVAAAVLTLGTYLAYMNLNWNAEFGVISDSGIPAKTIIASTERRSVLPRSPNTCA